MKGARIGMIDDRKTLGAYLSDPRIRQIAPDAIRNRDLSKEEVWNKTLPELRAEEFFGSDIRRGLERLFRAAEGGAWYFPLYTEAECAEDEARRGTNLVWLPSEDAGATERPYILLVPGGGFVNVWSLTEGWPIAAQFNELGYNVLVLTYQVTGERRLLDREMEDFARALRLIRANESRLSVRWDRYITCGFSAGGYLVCLWNVPEKGYAAHGLPGPQAVFPIYPVVTWKAGVRYEAEGLATGQLFDCSAEAAADSVYEIPEHVEGFPPCALFLAAGDELVDPENSKMLARALEARHIPCRLEIGPEGGHGFADGTGMCMDGWTERAIRWFEQTV